MNIYIFHFFISVGGCKKVLQVATAVPNVAIQQRKPSTPGDVLVTPTDGAAGSSADSDQGKATKYKVYPYASY